MQRTVFIPELDQAQAILDSLSRQIRRVAPSVCCPHGEVPCMSCALQWIVEEAVPLNFDPAFDEPEPELEFELHRGVA